jgi:solute carrier family 25 S-adenosylmethionine transporter 26
MKQQMQVGLDNNLRDTFRNVYAIQGLSGFYRGFPSVLLREIPFSGVQLPIYEYLRAQSLKKNRERHAEGPERHSAYWTNCNELNWHQSSLNGYIAGFVASLVTHPIDVKTKQMISREKKLISIRDLGGLIYREEGLAGFFRGWHVRTFSIGFVSIFFFATYEQSKKLGSYLFE